MRRFFERLRLALETTLRPEAVIFDLDGVIADVSESYRTAIIKTAERFGVRITNEDIERKKAAGGANNDWLVTHSLLAEHGVHVSRDEVTSCFQQYYEGTSSTPGLWEREKLIVSENFLHEISKRFRLGIVTGRPREDANKFLNHFGVRSYFQSVICMEDGPLKPSPEPVRNALKQLGVTRAWLIGDTPDDITAARRAEVLPIGVPPPKSSSELLIDSLYEAGAAVVLEKPEDLMRLL